MKRIALGIAGVAALLPLGLLLVALIQEVNWDAFLAFLAFFALLGSYPLGAYCLNKAFGRRILPFL